MWECREVVEDQGESVMDDVVLDWIMEYGTPELIIDMRWEQQ